jgi:dipeptidyl-peptidase-4
MKKLLLLCFIALTFFSNAQNKLLTLEDALVNNRTTLAPANLRQIQFIFNTSSYVYLGQQDGKDAWMKGDFASKSDQPFLTLTQLNHKLRSAGFDTVTAMPPIQFNQSAEWIMTINGNKVALDPIANKLKVLVPEKLADKENLEESKAGYIAYLDSFNLFVSDGKDSRQITSDGTRDIVYASSVHREEFGIVKGTFWSNSGKQLAFYRMDQSMVTDYPIIDWTERPAKNVNIKYPMAGDKSHHVTVGVYNAATQSLVWLKTGEPVEQYLTNIAWSPDDQSIYIAVVNRGQDHMKLNQYNATTGDFIKTLFEEHDQKYVEPLVPMMFVKNDPTHFIWKSRRDGWNHLYLFDVNGNLTKQLTKGEWEVTDIKGFDKKGENLFYASTKESPLTRNLYSVNLKSGISKRITPGNDEIHGTLVSTDGNFVIDNFSSLKNPRTIRIIDTRNGKMRQVFQAENPLAEYRLGDLSIFPINGPSGVPLYCRLYKPINFDSTKKYPAIVYWYGGSHVQLIGNMWNGGSGDYWFQYMAEHGYVVFSLDTRGSDYRGKEFEQAMYRKLGEPQMEDMMTGVNWLRSHSWVDKDNMGLFGWSFGGFNTVDFMLTHPDVFKVAVAGGPVIDWSYYEVMYTERYMDTPQENPEGYAATNLTNKIDKLKGKLLLIHGLQDNVVVQQHSVKLVRAAIDKNIQLDYMIYPGHEHNVLGKDRAHLYQKVIDYFTQNLSKEKLGF